ncbi:MAG: hypothetical protein ACPG7F_02085 [Aggregatilineales bacterium]
MPDRPQLQPVQQPDDEEEIEQLLADNPVLLQETLNDVLAENQNYQKTILRLREEVRREKLTNQQLRKKLTQTRDPFQGLLDAIGTGLILATAAAIYTHSTTYFTGL